MTSKSDTRSSDWRAERLGRIRALILEAAPSVTEEIKYRKPTNPAGVPVWYENGMMCTGETYKEHLRLTFAKGTKLKDPKGLLNSHRSMIIREGDKLNQTAFKALIREAVALNKALLATPKKKAKKK